jgi:putative oxidoreductase
MQLGTTLVRGVVGPLFIGHGAQKLWGSFGGHGIEGTGGFFESLGLRPGQRHAKAAGLAEFGGGALLTLGALTPVASTLISSTMLTAIRKVHAKNGPWTTEGGWEYNAVLVAAATALADLGPGSPSVDAALFPRMHGKGWAVASLLAAAAGSALATSPALNDGDPAPAAEAPTPADPASGGDDDRFTRDPSEIETPSQRTGQAS